jgi:hypothetical protein
MKVSINTQSIKQKEIVKAVIFTSVIGGFTLYKLGYVLGQLIYHTGN